MNPTFLIVAIVLSIGYLTDSAPSGDSGHVRLKIISHTPCTSSPTSSERIRFANMTQAPVVKDTSRGDGWYTINGPIQVEKPIDGTFQIYSELRLADIRLQPCRGADPNNCGGFGSCVCCDVCSNVKNIATASKGYIQLQYTNGKSLDCQKGIKPGKYNNVLLSFHLPKRDDLLQYQQLQDILLSQSSSNNCYMFYLKLYMFNEAVNTWPISKLQSINEYDKHVIGSHKIVGTVCDE